MLSLILGVIHQPSKDINGKVLIESLTAASHRREAVSVSHSVDLDLYSEAFSRYLRLANYSTDPAADMSFAIQPISAATVAAGLAKGVPLLD